MESKQNNNYQENKRFLSRLHHSKEEFLKQYEKIYNNKTKAKQLYLQLLSQLKKNILEDDVKGFEHFSNLLNYINDSENHEKLISFYDDEANVLNVYKSTNLIIFICKYNGLNIMKYVLDNPSIINDFCLKRKNTVMPDDEDGAGHTAFYYALRSNNIELADILIHKWPGNYFVHNLEKLDMILAKSYEELKLKNVLLSKEIELYIEDKLVYLRFFSDISNKVQNSINQNSLEQNSLDNIKQRIEIVLVNIHSLKECIDVNDKFLFTVKLIVKNIFILKKQLKSTYNQLPWEEIEFCLVCFVTTYLKKQEINLFYQVTLNKSRILKHLQIFAEQLNNLKNNLEKLDVKNLSILPKINRDKNVSYILENNPQFKDLYNDYEEIRDVHSLEKISNYVQLASSANPSEREGQLSIIRCLQVIGEYLKNTLESPKLSNFTSELLLLSLPSNTRKVFVNLRSSLSHVYSVTKRIEIEENENSDYFIGIQKDTKKIGSIITYILYKTKVKTIKVLLQKMIDSNNLEELREIAILFHTFKLESVDSKNLNVMEYEMLEKLIKELRDSVSEKTNYEAQLLKKMHDIIVFERNKLKNIEKEFFLGTKVINDLYLGLLDGSIDKNDIKLAKYYAEIMLENMASRIESKCLKQIAELASEICQIDKLKIKCENFIEINRLAYEIIYIAKFKADAIKWIDKLKEKLNSSAFIHESKLNLNYKISEEEKHNQLVSKIVELNNILTASVMSNQLKFPISKNDAKLLAALEMLILDILSILGSSKDYLENNSLFLDESTPLLIGKCLRDHLAHDYPLINIILSDPSITVFLNAKNLISENVVNGIKKIGKYIKEDLVKVKNRYNEGLISIHNQENMFIALKQGTLEDLKNCIAKGAEIYGRNNKLWTALHFAAVGHNTDIVRYLLDKNLDINAKNDANQSPLHIAAMYGNKNIVQLLIKEKSLCLNEKDNDGRTPLHYAAKNGYEDVVEILLKFKAHHDVKDTLGYAPIHYAVRNNHKDVVFTLLTKEINVDDNEASGCFTLLHLAAEKGHVDLVNYFLKLKANILATTDRGITPLHLAALRGHIDVVKTLISKGADVNSKGRDGCTPLHLAIEYGYKEIADFLLNHGADPNAVYNNYLYASLHFAAMYGYVEIVDSLLKKGAKANAATATNITPLHLAVKNGHLSTVDTFVRHGVNLDGNPFLHIAIEYGHKELVEYLIDHDADVSADFVNNVKPMHVAAASGHKDIVELLLAKHVEVNIKDVNGFTPLHVAVDKGHKDIVEILLKNNAHVNACTSTDTTPLHIAALNGNPEIVDLLIENNANVNATDCEGVKPLYLAAQHGHNNIVNSLINNTADVNAKNHLGVTALQAAVEAGYKEAVEILLANKALINFKNKYKCTTLSSAVRSNNKDIVEILIANGADVDAEDGQALLFAVLSGYDNIAKVLLRNNAQINVKYTDNNTLLHLAIMRTYKKVVDILISHGIDVNSKNNNNVTALHLAVRVGHADIVKTLLEHGADYCAKMKEGLAPLHIAACEGDIDVLEELLRYEVDINDKDDENRTPLELAIACGCFKAVKVLFHRTKVNINYKSINNFTFLHIAAQVGNLEIAKYLISNGADIHAKDVFGSKPVHIAAKEGHKDILDVFIGLGLSVNEPGRNNQTLLHYAALAGQSVIAQHLIDAGAEVNAKDSNEAMPIHMAAISGYAQCTKVLLQNGAMYNAVDMLNRKPVEITENNDITNLFNATERLFKAVKQNNLLEVQQCIVAGAFVNAKSVDNVTPLHHAAWKGYDDVVKILLQNNADPNAVGKQGLTPVHYAAKFSNLKVLKALLANGAVYDAVSDAGKTPLDIAEDKSVVNLLELIKESFEHVVSHNPKVVNDIRRLKDVDTEKAVMGAFNKAKKSLITLAIQCGYPKIEQLNQLVRCDLCDYIESAELMISQEEYDEARKLYEKVLNKRKEVLRSCHPNSLEIRSRIAKILYKQHKYQEALSMLEDIYGNQNSEQSTSVKDILNTKSTIALILHRQGKSEEALRMYEEIYTKQRETPGIPDSHILSTRFHMAVVLEGLDRNEDALMIFNEVLEKQKKLLGKRDPDTITTLNNIAALLDRMNKCDEALKVYTKVYETRKSILGPMHSDTLKASHNVISVLLKQKKINEAMEACKELLDSQNSILGPNHLSTVSTWHYIAKLYLHKGQYVIALKIFHSCLVQQKALLGAEHPEVLKTEVIIEQIVSGLNLDGIQYYILKGFEKEMKKMLDEGNGKFIEIVLENIIDVNEQDVNGRTLLHFAIDLGHPDVVDLLLKHGALVTKVTNKSNTPLHTATTKGHLDIVEVLLKQVSRDKLNEFINAKTAMSGATALHVAATNGHYEIVKCLLRHGAVYNVRNSRGDAPVDLAKDKCTLELLRSIDELFERARRGDEKLVDTLEAAKPDEFKAMTNTRDQQDKSIVQVALVNKHPQLASKLLKLLKMSSSN